jgi:hypothetical protein
MDVCSRLGLDQIIDIANHIALTCIPIAILQLLASKRLAPLLSLPSPALTLSAPASVFADGRRTPSIPFPPVPALDQAIGPNSRPLMGNALACDLGHIEHRAPRRPATLRLTHSCLCSWQARTKRLAEALTVYHVIIHPLGPNVSPQGEMDAAGDS